MLKNSASRSDSLLSSRLTKKDAAPKKPFQVKQVDISGLRGKAVEIIETPTYAVEQETVQPNALKQEKAPKQKKRKKKGLLRGNDEGLSSIVQAPEPTPEPKSDTAEDFDAVITEEDYKAIRRQECAAIRKNKVKKAVLSVTIVLCLYVAFLIYGLVQTNYIYNDSGEVVPEILSVEDLGTLSQYNALSNYYLRVRILYEKVLTIDYKLAQNSENGALLAMEYTDLLDNVSKLSTDIEAAQLDTAYTMLLNQMYVLVNTHIAVYLQNIASALTTNSSDRASQALAGREVIENEFATMTSNMVMLCNATNGANNGGIYSWSPTGFMESLVKEAA